MLVTATSEVVRIMGVWVRRADAGLARGAAGNAATSIQAFAEREREADRTLGDLRLAATGGSPAELERPAG